MTAQPVKEAFESLKLKAAKLKEENERLDRQNKDLEKEIQQLKNRDAQAQAKNAAVKERAGSFDFYSVRFPEPMDPAALRSSAEAIRKADPEAIVFLADSQGFCVAASGGGAQQRGIGANEIVKFSTEVAGGSGGGRPDIAQGRLKEPGRFPEVLDRIRKFINEKAKG